MAPRPSERSIEERQTMSATDLTPGILPLARRAILAFAFAAASLAVATTSATASAPAEAYVQNNVQTGLSILNNRSASTDQKREQFEHFILGLTDMKRIANFTLGQYKRTASPQEQEAFAQAFQSYAIAVYQSYFSKYSGQTLKVTGSQQRNAAVVLAEEGAELIAFLQRQPDSGDAEIDHDELAALAQHAEIDFERRLSAFVV